jgi:site-specific recombinase XerD
MECKTKNIDVLIQECVEHLRSLEYSDACIGEHRRKWRDGILPYMKENGIPTYSSDIGEQYLLDATKRVAPSTARGRARNIHILSDYLENGLIARRIVHLVEYPLSGEIGEVAQVFLQTLKSSRRSELTVGEHHRMLSYFISGMALKSKTEVKDIKEQDILDFVGSAQHCKDKHYNTIRLFCRFLYEQKYVDDNLEYVLVNNRFPKHEKLPSVYSSDEIKQIEASVEQSSAVGKRDYAILLLASRLGLRASDICGLKFSNIDWDENKIVFAQYKTQRWIELPLLADTGEAIVNYLKYGRPVSNLPEIFLTAVAPYRSMNHIGLNGVIARIMQKSGVDISQRKFGPHSMRHSLASQLLRNGISLPVISETLGHATTQTTMEYLRIDISSLIKCTLEVPLVNPDFYGQKGGVFYE